LNKYDVQYRINKKLFIEGDNNIDGFIMGMNRSELVEDYIKPKI